MTKKRKNRLREMDGLYHCTSFCALNSIFQTQAFYPFFCLEEAAYLKKSLKFAFAVVSFADMRYGELKEHMRQFSSDAYIKMSKEWAIRNTVSPVTYYSDKSTLSSTIFRMLVNYAAKTNKDYEFYNPLNMFLGLLKQYRGYYYQKNLKKFSDHEVCFYLEREWRYLPLVMDHEAYFITEDQFMNATIRTEKEKELVSKKYILSFNWDDILQVGVKPRNFIHAVGMLSNKFSVPWINAASKVKVMW